jgi:hypothetical protein
MQSRAGFGVGSGGLLMKGRGAGFEREERERKVGLVIERESTDLQMWTSRDGYMFACHLRCGTD